MKMHAAGNSGQPVPSPVQTPRHILRAIVFASILLSWITRVVHGAIPGSLDPTFDPGSSFAPATITIPVRVIYPFADGSFLLGGYFTNYNGVPRPGLAKILEDGALDTGFEPDSSLFTPRAEIWGIDQQPDGKFIIAGLNTTAPTGAKILRLNTDGSLDSSFSFPKLTSTFAMAVDVRPDGLISYLTDDNFGIGLLRPDGSRLLTSGGNSKPFGLFNRIRISAEGHTFYSHNSGLFRFGHGFGLPDDVQFNGGGGMTYDFDFQSDGRIVCINSGTGNGLRRYFPDGLLDTNFLGKISGPDIDALVCLPDDKILVGGSFTTVSGLARRNFTRLNSDGSLDTNFITGAGPNSTVYAIAPVANGKALIAGKFTSYDGLSRTGLARIFLDAPATPTFVTQPKSIGLFEGQSLRLSAAINASSPIHYQWKKEGQPVSDGTNSVLYIPRAKKTDAGTYVLEVTTPGGSATSLEALVGVAPPLADIGGPIPSFAVGEAASRAVNAYLDLDNSNRKSLVGGDFVAYDGQLQPALVRLHADGSLDPSLNLNLPPNSTCTSLAKLSDGKILAGFTSARSGAVSLPVLLRLNGDGSLDASFFPGLSADVLAIAPLPNGKALIGGVFTSLGGISRTRLARLNPDCSIDQSFDVNALQLTKVLALAVQPDGKILIADQNRFLRLSENGSVETDWPLTTVRAIALQPDQKILIGGHFASVNGIARTNLARLNADMSVDANFNPAAGAAAVTTSAVLSIVVQPDEKIIVAGNFSELVGAPCNNIGRLSFDGSLDPSFQPDVNLDRATTRVAINTMSLTFNNDLTIGGLFSRVNDFTHNSIARLYATVLSSPTLAAVAAQTQSREVTVKLTFPTDSSYTLEYTDAFPDAWQDYGPLPNNTNTIELPLIGSQRFYRLKQP
jgi:uncharacterized delta-60 repeat protein